MIALGLKDLGFGFVFVEKGSPLLSSCLMVEKILSDYRGIQFFTGEIILNQADASVVKLSPEKDMTRNGIDGYTNVSSGKFTIFWIRDNIDEKEACGVVRNFIFKRIGLSGGRSPTSRALR